MKHPIFNYPNLSKYLWIEKKEIKFFTVCMPTCVVTLITGERIKINASDLIKQLNSDRKERAKEQIKNYEMQEYPYWFVIKNRLSGEKYRLDPELDCINCSCDDYGNMKRMLGEAKVNCKHGYMLLNHLGFNSILDPEYSQLVSDCYIQAQGEAIAERNEMMSYAWYNDSRHWG